MTSNYFKIAVWTGAPSELRAHGPLPRPKRRFAIDRDVLDRSPDRSLDDRQVRNWVFPFDERDSSETERAHAVARAKLDDLRSAGAAPLLSVFRRIPGGPPVIGDRAF